MDFVSSTGKISFFEMAPMNELQNFLRQALTYVLNIATTHNDRLVWMRYNVAEAVLSIELLLQSYYL